MSDSFEDFMGRFNFNPAFEGRIGVESESLICDSTGSPVPCAAQVLTSIYQSHPEFAARIGYELSACQLEERTPPLRVGYVARELQATRKIVRAALEPLGLSARYAMVGPDNMSTEIYPDERYLRITKTMPPQRLLAACRIIGTHIHYGAGNADTALRIYNRLIRSLGGLRAFTDKTNGERRRIYRNVTPRTEPMSFENWHHMHEVALREEWAEDVRHNWSDVRISGHGTIEIRFPDGSDCPEEIERWARTFRALCLGSM